MSGDEEKNDQYRDSNLKDKEPFTLKDKENDGDGQNKDGDGGYGSIVVEGDSQAHS